ncbi:hypothetical protein FDP41_004335 [Naegleria fowleri]|uniref:non-specific serine/threonine protein kinase n=1 Tax=Naegleria fowleri TaxID=5763 RepID=A0A6A5BNB5_NAEFO|nr:uncharacterized protein FDP41_004335 [Naegleria fowleri]KAF0976436.1 hypothetical protein FDP41_004335 [Naegleria fowleri]CAG4716102.1 unnamed protein product [Naegleria fowleri]
MSLSGNDHHREVIEIVDASDDDDYEGNIATQTFTNDNNNHIVSRHDQNNSNTMINNSPTLIEDDMDDSTEDEPFDEIVSTNVNIHQNVSSSEMDTTTLIQTHTNEFHGMDTTDLEEHKVINVDSDHEERIQIGDNVTGTQGDKETPKEIQQHLSSHENKSHESEKTISPEEIPSVEGNQEIQNNLQLLESRYQKVIWKKREFSHDSRVCEVLLKENGEKRTVKTILLPPHGNMQEYLDLATKITQLNHPNIIPMYPPFILGNLLCIEMDYMEHGSLEECFESIEKPPSEKMLHSLLQQVASALQYMNSQKSMLHRNIIPSSILVKSLKYETDEIHVCLSGFVFEKSTHYWPIDERYVSPDIRNFVKDEKNEWPYSPASDVFSLGATLCWTMTGQAILSDEPQEVKQHLKNLQRTNYSEMLHEVVTQMMHPDPTKRLTLEELQKSLTSGGTYNDDQLNPSVTKNYSFLKLLAVEFSKQKRNHSEATTNKQVLTRPIRTKTVVSSVSTPAQNDNILSQPSESAGGNHSKIAEKRVGSDFSSEEVIQPRSASFVKSRKYRKSKSSTSSSLADTSMKPPARTKLLSSPPPLVNKTPTSKESHNQVRNASLQASSSTFPRKTTVLQDKTIASSSSQITRSETTDKTTSLAAYRLANLDIGLIDMIMDPKITEEQFEAIENEFYEIFPLTKVEKLSKLVDDIIAEDMKRRETKR